MLGRHDPARQRVITTAGWAYCTVWTVIFASRTLFSYGAEHWWRADIGVPLPDLGALVAGIEAPSARREVTIAVLAHAGDGNTHPLIVFDPTDQSMSVRAQAAYGEVMNLATSLGGTITGEHGVGRLKRALRLST